VGRVNLKQPDVFYAETAREIGRDYAEGPTWSQPTVATRTTTVEPTAPVPDGDDRPRPSQATRIVELALGAGIELWHTPTGDPHVTIPLAGHREHHHDACEGQRDGRDGRDPGDRA